jgi:chromosome segregation ATPase
MEKYYNQVRRKINSFIAEVISRDLAMKEKHYQRKLNELYEELNELNRHQSEMSRLLIRFSDSKETRDFILSCLRDTEKDIRKVEKSIRSLASNSNKKAGSNWITQEMIENAKNYPFSSLIELKRNMALCPFHDDRRPSLSVKNNRFHCFGCGLSGDTIKFVMLRDGLSFPEAVRLLQF